MPTEDSAFTRIPGWVQIALHSTQQGTEVVNTFNYQSDSNITTSSEIQAVAENWTAFFLSYIRAYTSENQAFVKVVARTLYPLVQNLVYEHPLSVGTLGFRVGDTEPGNVAISVARYSSFYGRRNRGRFYAGRFSEDDVLGNFATTTLQQLLGVAASILLRSFGAAGIQLIPVVASRVGGYLVRISSSALDNFIDSMRRRLAGRGR